MRRFWIVFFVMTLVLAGMYGPARTIRALASAHSAAPAVKKHCKTVIKKKHGKKTKVKVCTKVKKPKPTATDTPVPPTDTATPTSTSTATSTATATVTPTGITKATTVTVYTGNLGGADFKIEKPDPWNGTLVLYSHGFVIPGSSNPAQDAPNATTAKWLTDHNFAILGSSFSQTGWSVEQGLHDQMALLDYFTKSLGTPQRVIAWGISMGGLITAGLIQNFPDRFVGAVPMCGVLGGAVGLGNTGLDASFAFKTLVAADKPIVLTHIYQPVPNINAAKGALQEAQASPQGVARVALTAALYDIPGWFTPGSSEPGSTDFTTQEQNQYQWLSNVLFPLDFGIRAELEQRAGGNVSWNTKVDYAAQLRKSRDYEEVKALYGQAGLNLDADLQKLAAADRIPPEPGPVAYLQKNIVFNGQIKVPVLTVHTTGDGFVPVENEQAYADVVNAAGNSALLRQTYIHRAGHCTFTPAEAVTAFQTELHRIDTGTWDDTNNADALNAAATNLGPQLNASEGTPIPPAFIPYTPGPYLRPFDARSQIPS